MQPSIYQQQILEWLTLGKGNGCCNAVAGSGKSTTLKLGAIALQKSGLHPSECKIIVFGKSNSLDLIAKFGTEWKESISTLHSAGWTLLKDHCELRGNTRNLIKSTKYKAIAQDQGFIAKRGAKGTLKNEGAIDKEADFTKLIDLVRLTNSKPTKAAVIDICQHFEIQGVWKPEIIARAIDMVLKIGENQAMNKESFDFTDQIWLPVKWKLAPRRPYKFVLIDECQDLNAAQLELALQLAGKKGRLLFVGDPRQAIFGFAGADNRSYQKIVDRTKATELPLSICYRCPTEHIKLVKRIFPEILIEPAENAPQGSIVQCSEKDLDTHLKVGDMVISRKTAPLVSLCIKLIAKGIKATVKGRDIGETIKRDLEAISEVPGFTYSKFHDAVNQYKASLLAKYEGLDNEEQLKENLTDKLDALQTIYTSQTNAKSIADLETYIDSLFSDESSPITLSTCHRAKGLEGDRIFLHRAEDMPMRWRNQLDWQLEQEENLLYVALTRSKSELFIVGDPEWLKLEDEPAPEEDTTEQQIESEIEADSFIPAPPSTDFEITRGWVNIGLITLDAGTQSRKQTDQATIDEYAEQMASGRWQWEREPAPILFFDGENYFPGDGHHRIEGAAQNREDIYAEIRPGTLRDAIFYSTQANRFHGLQRTRADKRNQVELLLLDSEWQTMSDRAIADHCGVSAPFVGNIRRELVESGTVNNFSERTDRKGRTIETGNIGRKGSGKSANSSPNETDTSSQISENLVEPIDQPIISENLAPEIEVLQPQGRTIQKTRIDPDCEITPHTQEMLKSGCTVWGLKAMVEFALKYATEDDLQATFDLLESAIERL